VVVDVDEVPVLLDGLADGAEALEAGAVGGAPDGKPAKTIAISKVLVN
jgi:hypothetical protein